MWRNEESDKSRDRKRKGEWRGVKGVAKVTWSLVTLLSGHLRPYSTRPLATLLSGHLRPYPFIYTPPPAFHNTMVSILLLYLNFPPCVPLNHCLHSTSLFKLPPCVPLYHGLHSTSLFKLFPPCVPLKHCLHSTSSFNAFHYFMDSILLLYLNFPPLLSTIPLSPFYFFIWTSPPCVPLNHCLHSTSLSKLPPLRSTKPLSPFYFFISTSPPCVPLYHGLHSTSLFKLPPGVPPYNGLHSTSLFKLTPPAFHYTMVSILLLYLNSPPLRSTKPLSPFYFFI